MSTATPVLTGPRSGHPDGVVLVLHGGRANSERPARPWQLAALRMLPLAWSLNRQLPNAAVVRLRYRYRGWNAPYEHPVADARWALEEIRRRFGDVPVVLVGHSMGGRTAMRVVGEPHVRGIVGLAPWLPPGEPMGDFTDRYLAILHGDHDRVTDANTSRAYAQKARELAEVATWVSVAGSGHAMLQHARLWHRLAAEFVAAMLDPEPLTGPHSNVWVTPGTSAAV